MLSYAYIAYLVIATASLSEDLAANVLSTTCNQNTYRVGPACLPF
jgi:hypothetical protein